MIQLNENEFPPGGWQFRQPQTGWTNPMAMVGFDASRRAIVKHRLANKAITLKHQLSTDLNVVGEELKKFQRARLGIPDPAPSFFQPSSSRLPRLAVAAAADIKRAAQGTSVVLDWLTSGGNPVERALAENRAETCVQCPKNVPGSWYTVAPAELIKSTLEARKDLKLQTAQDENLKSCDVCKCLMRLKVWTPLEFIVNNTKPEIMSEFPQNCWIAKRDQ